MNNFIKLGNNIFKQEWLHHYIQYTIEDYTVYTYIKHQHNNLHDSHKHHK